MKLFNCITALCISAGCAAAPANATATTPVDLAVEPAAIDEPADNITAAAAPNDTMVTGRLRVSGEGKIELTPDMARITLSVESKSRNADKAVTQNAADTKALLGTLSAAGVADADVKTAGYEVFPGWRRGQTNVQTTITVTVRDLSALGGILKKSLETGATTAQGIQFDVSDRDAQEKAAMKLAVTDARDRGEALASAAGRSLGDVVSIDSSISDAGRWYYDDIRAEGGASDIPIAPGTLAINVEVTVAFGLEA